MAKPGSSDAARIAAGGEDLSRLRMSDEEAREATEMMELSLGLRCNGCGKRIGRGFSFVSIAVKEKNVLMKLAACARPECEYAAACRNGGTYVEMVEYVWLDEAGMDADPCQSIVRQNEKLAKAQDAKRATENRAEQTDEAA
jgi:hypothetical protein